MVRVKVTLSVNKETWKSFKIHCIKNNVIASVMVNDWMASVTTGKPIKHLYDIKVKK